jgi:hypothetical protein
MYTHCNPCRLILKKKEKRHNGLLYIAQSHFFILIPITRRYFRGENVKNKNKNKFQNKTNSLVKFRVCNVVTVGVVGYP